MEPADVVAQIDEVLNSYLAAKTRAKFNDLSDLGPAELATLVVRAQATVDRLTLASSTYAAVARERRDHADIVRLPALIGILGGLKADVQAGYLMTVAELLHATTFADFLEMGTELLDKGYKDPAAVLAGSVLEAHLRTMCAKYGVATTITSGAAKKADVMNAELVKTGAYNTIEQKQVTADLGVRNSAAHGNYSDYTADQVRSLVTSVRQFLIRHPA